MQVRNVPTGSIIRIGDPSGKPGFAWDYRVVYSNDCRAYVEPVGRGKREIRSAEGEVLAEVEDRSGRVNISPGADCIILDKEIEEMAAGSEPVVVKRGGDRYFPPKIQSRPVRSNTTRAKMLAFIQKEKMVDVDDVMIEFDMNRNLVIAHVHEMHKCHGYGYKLVGDKLTIINPVIDDGVEDLL